MRCPGVSVCHKRWIHRLTDAARLDGKQGLMSPGGGEQYVPMEPLSRILLALAWGAREISENKRCSLDVGAEGLMFVTDSKSGKFWAYWRATEPNGQISKQGFRLLERHGSMRGSLDIPSDATSP